MSKAVIMIGLPGSGKTTFLEECYTAKSGFIRLSSDDFIENKAVELNKPYNEIFHDYIKEAQELFEKSLDLAIKNGDKIVIDRTNLDRQTRKGIITSISKEYKITAVYFEPDPQRIRHVNEGRHAFGRSIPDDVLGKMIGRIQEPEYHEGFHERIFVERR